MRILAGEHLHLLYDGAAYQTQSTSKGGGMQYQQFTWASIIRL